MVRPEDRRGTRWDMEKVSKLVFSEGKLSKGQIMYQFGWGTTKTDEIMKAVAEAHPEVEKWGRELVVVDVPTPKPIETEEEDIYTVEDRKEVLERVLRRKTDED